ncbi:MAG: sugar ABC transporter substrate-binding protein [Clostridia bacterium]|nr:sugar ABC transporter substrate-binding protein [Clostridia bacterium]
MKKLCLYFLVMFLALSFIVPAMAESEMYQRVMSRFHGELEQGAVVQVLENATSIELGYAQQLIDAFNAAYQGLGVSAKIMDIDQYSDLATDGPYGYGPDVWYQANDILMKYATKQHLLPLPIFDLECYPHTPRDAWDAYKMVMYDEPFFCGVPINVQSGMLFYIESMLPDDWQTQWDLNQNGMPDFFETFTALYAYSKAVQENGGTTKYGYLDDLVDVYFSFGYLFTGGAYVFGSDDTDPADIGLAKGDAAKCASMLRQWAALMNNTEALDKAFASAAYSYLAQGTMLCTITTPDVKQMFVRAMINTGSWTREEAEADLKMIPVPRLPKSYDLTGGPWQDTITDMDNLTTQTIMMGGMNGFGISAYTQCPNASLAFIQFAASFPQVMERNRMLGISPARGDAAAEIGKDDATVQMMFDNLDNNLIYIMPAINEMSQLWTPGESFLIDLCTDAFRSSRGEPELYTTIEQIQAALERMVQQILDAIFTLS